ncbi:hypothetical protein [Persicitalea jodogahamensis]|uniref:hypothetical protein n=1 Tax=Persicitalea jodogahamensis TaxID=402147 RepID=UPI001678175D|nr:hypothetical protein [Persicitalea jodogahamensis]
MKASINYPHAIQIIEHFAFFLALLTISPGAFSQNISTGSQAWVDRQNEQERAGAIRR